MVNGFTTFLVFQNPVVVSWTIFILISLSFPGRHGSERQMAEPEDERV
jgi:hypothetical protein